MVFPGPVSPVPIRPLVVLTAGIAGPVIVMMAFRFVVLCRRHGILEETLGLRGVLDQTLALRRRRFGPVHFADHGGDWLAAEVVEDLVEEGVWI